MIQTQMAMPAPSRTRKVSPHVSVRLRYLFRPSAHHPTSINGASRISFDGIAMATSKHGRHKTIHGEVRQEIQDRTTALTHTNPNGPSMDNDHEYRSNESGLGGSPIS